MFAPNLYHGGGGKVMHWQRKVFALHDGASLGKYTREETGGGAKLVAREGVQQPAPHVCVARNQTGWTCNSGVGAFGRSVVVGRQSE